MNLHISAHIFICKALKFPVFFNIEKKLRTLLYPYVLVALAKNNLH